MIKLNHSDDEVPNNIGVYELCSFTNIALLDDNLVLDVHVMIFNEGQRQTCSIQTFF